jgi:hypothetical protein
MQKEYLLEQLEEALTLKEYLLKLVMSAPTQKDALY